MQAGPFTVALWTRIWDLGVCNTNVYVDSIECATVPPVASARDISLQLDSSTVSRALAASDVDFGSCDAVSGINSISVSPDVIVEGPNSVVFTVLNNVGLSVTTNVTVTGIRAPAPSASVAEPELPDIPGLYLWFRGDYLDYTGYDNGALFSFCSGTCEIRNSLIAGCDNLDGIFDGANGTQAILRNCTVTGCRGGFNCFDVYCWIYNSIIVGNGSMNFIRGDINGRTDLGNHSGRLIYMVDSILWDTDLGLD